MLTFVQGEYGSTGTPAPEDEGAATSMENDTPVDDAYSYELSDSCELELSDSCGGEDDYPAVTPAPETPCPSNDDEIVAQASAPPPYYEPSPYENMASVSPLPADPPCPPANEYATTDETGPMEEPDATMEPVGEEPVEEIEVEEEFFDTEFQSSATTIFPQITMVVVLSLIMASLS